MPNSQIRTLRPNEGETHSLVALFSASAHPTWHLH
jgi:hypothetical protein